MCRKSGKMVIRMGDVEFDVTPSQDPGVSQLFCIVQTPDTANNANSSTTTSAMAAEKKKAEIGNLALLAECKDRLICTPDIQSLLN